MQDHVKRRQEGDLIEIPVADEFKWQVGEGRLSEGRRGLYAGWIRRDSVRMMRPLEWRFQLPTGSLVTSD